MPSFKNLLRVSLGLLIVNFLLIGIVLVNNSRTERKRAELQLSIDEAEVQGASTSVPIFDPSQVVSNTSFTSTRVCSSPQAIQNILNQFNSPLKNYSTDGRSAADWIWLAARGQTSSRNGITPQLNPCMLIVFLEKEQSLLTGNFSSGELQSRLNVAMGYGCPDGNSCAPQFKGFANQVNWAAYQLQFNFNLATSSTPDAYQVGRTIYTLDGINVFISNAATASAYRYTPHVYWGNYNLWKIMTANGWGASSQTYSYQQLDGVNIPNRKNILAEQYANRIKESDVADYLYNPPAIGTVSDQVKLLQEFLRQEGYFTYPIITGFYGTITESARTTYIANSDNRQQRDSLCDSLYSKNYKIGQTGDEIRQLQECLKSEGLYAWPVITGYYGPVTEQGLNTIKSRRGIGVNPPSNPTPINSGGSTIGNAVTTSRGVSASGLNMRDNPCGNRIAVIPWNQGVTISGNPVSKTCFGNTWNWIQTSYNGQTGWVVDFHVEVKDSNSKIIKESKPIQSFPKNFSRIFKTNSRGVSANGLTVRDNPCGNRIDTVAWDVQGGEVSGPVSRSCLGGNWDWYEVSFENGLKGWVAGFYLDVISGESKSNQKFLTNSRGTSLSGLNFRDSPCGTKEGVLPWNVEVIQVAGPITKSCFGNNFSWIRIVTPDGRDGWVASQYLNEI